MPTLAVVERRAALLVALQARLPGVQVATYWLGPTMENEGIYLADLNAGEALRIEIGSDDIAGGSTYQPIEEDAVVGLTCQSWLATTDPTECATAQDRVLHLFGGVIDTLRTDDALRKAVAWKSRFSASLTVVPYGTAFAVRLSAAIPLRSYVSTEEPA